MAAVAAATLLLRRALLKPFPLSSTPTHLERCEPFVLHISRPFSGGRPRGLRPAVPPAFTSDDDGDGEVHEEVSVAGEKKSRNELKREACRAVRWGMELANFSPPQIKRVLRAAALEQEVFDALMLVKRFGPDVREGRRRQFNYIGRLLRDAKPDLMNTLIQATKDGDTSTLMAMSSQATLTTEEVEDDLAGDEEDDEDYMDLATRWFDGLVNKDASITKEVYSIDYIEYDRQELRKLVRRVHSLRRREKTSEDDEKSGATFAGVKKPLLRFLQSLARDASAEQSTI